MKADDYARLYGLSYSGRKRRRRRLVYVFEDLLTGNTLLVGQLTQLRQAVVENRAPGFDDTLKAESLKRADKVSADFYGFEPRRHWQLDLDWPSDLVSLGPCVQVDYLSDKFDGVPRRYFHRFEPGAVLYADPDPQADGSQILVIHGQFRIEPEGITG